MKLYVKIRIEMFSIFLIRTDLNGKQRAYCFINFLILVINCDKIPVVKYILDKLDKKPLASMQQLFFYGQQGNEEGKVIKSIQFPDRRTL